MCCSARGRRSLMWLCSDSFCFLLLALAHTQTSPICIIYAQLDTFIYYLCLSTCLPFFLCFRASSVKPVVNVTTIWTVGYYLRQSLQKCWLTESVYKGIKKFAGELLCTFWFDRGTTLSPRRLGVNGPQSPWVHECGQWDWTNLVSTTDFFLPPSPFRGSVCTKLHPKIKMKQLRK